MRITLQTCVWWLAWIAVAGCSPGPLDEDPFASWPRHDRSLDSLRRRLSEEVGRVSVTERRAPRALNEAPTPGPELSDAASADDYVRLALERNPTIRAARQKVARLAERVPQVTSLDDPMFQVAPFGEMAETAAGEVGLMTGLSQKLPTPGKLGARGRAAAREAAEAAAELNETALAIVADTRRAYWSYYFSARAIEVTRANRELLSQLRQIAEAKLRAGTATQQDVLRASVELSNIDNELLTLRQQQTTAAAMLNRLIDRPVTAPLPSPGPVELETLNLELEALLREAEARHPALQRVRERIGRFRERLELARLNRWPDLTVSANYNAVDDEGRSRVANGDDQWWFGFGVNLPIWTAKLDAAEREARRGVLEGLADLNGAHNRIAFGVQDALTRVETDQRLVILFRDVIVPQARQTVDASLSGYRAGSLDFLTLVDNWRKLLDFELMYHRNLSRLEQDFAELQRAVGRDLQRRTDNGDEATGAAPDPRPDAASPLQATRPQEPSARLPQTDTKEGRP